MASSQGASSSTVTGALGNLIGYIGGEAATTDIFERLLWPQRFYNGCSLSDIPIIVLLMPMMGPLHSAALATLDLFRANGLFRGPKRGNMLGTSFYTNSGLQYQRSDAIKGLMKDCRNCLWIRVLSIVGSHAGTSKLKSLDKKGRSKDQIRSLAVVCQLTLNPTEKLTAPRSSCVWRDVGPASWRVYLMLVASETISLLVGILAATIWRSWFAFLWLAPVLLKLISAIFALSRDGLGSVDGKGGPSITVRIDLPSNRIAVMTGPEATMLQFFRHYGHPIRNRAREIVQMTIVVASALVFPAGLVMSTIWMPTGLQYVWLVHQLYNTIVIYIYRFAGSHLIATTESCIARILEGQIARGEGGTAYLCSRTGTAVAATLDVGFHDSWDSARQTVQQLMSKS